MAIGFGIPGSAVFVYLCRLISCRGIDLQKLDFERGRPSYLRGEWNDHGWWYYYLVGLLVKSPVGTIGLAVMAAIHAFMRRSPSQGLAHDGSGPRASSSSGDQVVLLSPARLGSNRDACSGFSCHYRYVLPAFPFAFVWMSQVAAFDHRQCCWRYVTVVGLLSATACETAMAYPHCISFFNLIAGGPTHGSDWMLDSSFYWGQDMHFLKYWLHRHAPDEIPFVTLSMRVPPEEFDIPSRGKCPPCVPSSDDPDGSLVGPVPGLHVIDAEAILERDSGYAFFQTLQPIARVGYALRVYRITAAEANRIRKSRAGLAPSQPCEQSADELIGRLAKNAAMARALKGRSVLPAR